MIRVQSGYKAQPLSALPESSRPPAPPAIEFPPINDAAARTNFFKYLDFALQFAPARTGGGCDPRKARAHWHRHRKDDAHEGSRRRPKLQVGLAMKEGAAKVEQYLTAGQKDINGWKVGSLFGDRAFYHGDWLKRAAAAKGRHLRQQRHRGHVIPCVTDAGQMARPWMAASTTTYSPSPPDGFRRSMPSGP